MMRQLRMQSYGVVLKMQDQSSRERDECVLKLKLGRFELWFRLRSYQVLALRKWIEKWEESRS